MATKKNKKMVDKWKLKKWYEVVAPKMFNNKIIGEAVTADEKDLINRIIITSLAEVGTDFTGNRRMLFSTKVKLRIFEVKGKSAYTKYIGHEIIQSYMRTLARKGRSVIDMVEDYKTKDGEGVRLKVVAITGSNVSQNTKKNLRKAAEDVLNETIPNMTLEDVALNSLHGKISGNVYSKLKKITKMTKVEVKKIEIKEAFA